jgi:hypothetical protein
MHKVGSTPWALLVSTFALILAFKAAVTSFPDNRFAIYVSFLS